METLGTRASSSSSGVGMASRGPRGDKGGAANEG
jgi:hypothetical protein